MGDDLDSTVFVGWLRTVLLVFGADFVGVVDTDEFALFDEAANNSQSW